MKGSTEKQQRGGFYHNTCESSVPEGPQSCGVSAGFHILKFFPTGLSGSLRNTSPEVPWRWPWSWSTRNNWIKNTENSPLKLNSFEILKWTLGKKNNFPAHMSQTFCFSNSSTGLLFLCRQIHSSSCFFAWLSFFLTGPWSDGNDDGDKQWRKQWVIK